MSTEHEKALVYCGTHATDISIDCLQQASKYRSMFFKTGDGEPVTCNWTPERWVTAFIGEVGEACNLYKKTYRGDYTLDEARPKIAHELADAQIYLTLLAESLGINLAEATVDKFNIVSRRIDSPIALGPNVNVFTVNENVPNGPETLEKIEEDYALSDN